MKIQNNKTNTTTIALAIVFGLAMIVPTTAFGETAGLTATTDKTVYQYGQTINLKIDDFNAGNQKEISLFKNNYAFGMDDPCGIPYLSFDFLSGNFSGITAYDQLVAVKEKSLNVLFPFPDNAVLCPSVVKGYQHVSINSNSSNAVMTITDKNGKTHTHKMTLLMSLPIQYQYSKSVLHKQFPSGQVLDYRDKQQIPAGTYTVIALTLDGEISKPVVIQVTNNTGTQNASLSSSSTSLPPQKVGFLSQPSLSMAPMFLGTAAFGTVMAVNYRKTGRLNGLGTSLAVALLVIGILPLTTANQAFASYSTSSQGVEAYSTGTSFTQATLEDEFNGFQTVQYTGNPDGFSTQNNEFIDGYAVGNNYLWSQSVVQTEATSSYYNVQTCTDQDGNSVNCYMPDSVKMRGVINFWTDAVAGTCPSGFTYITSQGACALVSNGSWTSSISLPSTITRLDLNAYQEIQSTGDVYLDQKYRTCQGSSCGSYTSLYSYTASGYAQSPPNGYFGSYFDGANYWYGVSATVGECGTCDNGSGTVAFQDGTYVTHVYTINSSTSPGYRGSGVTSFPGEENKYICWHDTISNSGGSNPTLTTSAKYNTSCSS